MFAVILPGTAAGKVRNAASMSGTAFKLIRSQPAMLQITAKAPHSASIHSQQCCTSAMGADAQVEAPQAPVVEGKLETQRPHRGVQPHASPAAVALAACMGEIPVTLLHV